MAPPSKRRRVSWPAVEMLEGTPNPDVHHKHGFSHAVTKIETPSESLTAVEELHIQTQHQVVAQGQHEQALVARQASADTGALSSSTVSLSAATSSLAAISTTSSDLPSSSNISTISSINSILSSSTSSLRSTTTTSSSTSLSNISSVTSITSSSPPVTSSIPASSTPSANNNITIAANVLTTALNGTFFGAASRTGSITSSFPSNSSYTFSLSSITDSASTSNDGGMATSVYLTTATISQNGQAASTITTAVGAAGYGGSASPTSTASVNSGTENASTPPPPGTIAGGVVGGAAGIAVLLLVAMLFLRWYRRRSQARRQELLPGSAGDYHDTDAGVSRDGPGMAERAGIRPWAAAFPGIMRHQMPNDSSRSLVAATPHERSFQRISGRKLPSAWSPGMDGPPPPMPGGTVDRASGASSFYPDTAANVNPFADSADGATPEDGSSLGRQRSDERMTVVPGPQRRPTIHDPTRNLAVESQQKHMSSMARTSGTASMLLHTNSSNSGGSSRCTEQTRESA